jgi:thioredoxin-like negative regulator of GroEL
MYAVLDAPIRTSASVLDRILATGHPAVIAFEVPDCGPCQELRPILDSLAREFQDRALFVRVTDAGEGWLAARHHLSFVPTLLFWRDGAEHARIKGNPGWAAVRSHVEFLIRGEPSPEPAEGPRHTLLARFGSVSRKPTAVPRALLRAGTQAAAR